jgi:hypothetical protein
VAVFCSSTGTRYDFAAQAPRSINWHRSEQNGRNRLSFFHSTGAPQDGHAPSAFAPWQVRDCRT